MTAATPSLNLLLHRGLLRRALEAMVGALFAIGVVGVGVALATTRPPAPLAPGTARLVPGDAAVTVHRGTPVAAADALLRAGDTVVVDRGVAELRTRAGSMYAHAGSTIAFTDAAPQITRGDVLVRGKAFEVAMRAATAQITGIGRVRQGLSLEIGVYRGAANVRTPSESLVVESLRRAVVAGAGAPGSMTTAPLVIKATDPWDRKLLGDAIELDAALTARSRGLTMQVAAGTSDVMDKVLATTRWKDALAALGNEPIGEVVVAAELARAAQLGNVGIVDALRLRSEGASWGLIAIGQGVHTVPPTFTGLDNVVVPTIAPAVIVPSNPSTPVVAVPAVTMPRVSAPTLPTITRRPPVTVPAPTGESDDGAVDKLVSKLGDVIGGLLGH